MRVLAVLFPDYTPIDLIGPISCWRFLPAYQLQIASVDGGLVTGDNAATVQATHSLDDCWADPDVLLVPGGGHAAFRALQDDRLLDAIARIGARAQWVASVCNGSLLLGAAGLLTGYRAACYWYSREYLARFGAIPDPARVVIDRNRATGGGMTAGIDFGLRTVAHWAGDEMARIVELSMEYAPEPPFGCGRPELAPPQTLGAVESILAHEMPNALATEAARRRGFPSVEPA